MARVFITGSADGLGMMAARLLIEQGHQVVLHARNDERAIHARERVPGAQDVLIADLSNMTATKELAAEVNKLQRFDAIIHNAGVYEAPNSAIFHVNSLAPYILTCLIHPPKRLIYLSSGMHMQGDPNIGRLSKDGKNCSYSDSKLHILLLSNAIARKWPAVYSNAVNPGWVPTKMGGRGAPDNLKLGVQTQVWLAVSDDRKARVSGSYFYHQQERNCLDAAHDINVQEQYLLLCKSISSVTLKNG